MQVLKKNQCKYKYMNIHVEIAINTYVYVYVNSLLKEGKLISVFNKSKIEFKAVTSASLVLRKYIKCRLFTQKRTLSSSKLLRLVTCCRLSWVQTL